MARGGGASRIRIRVLPSVALTAAILLLPALLYAWGRQADAFNVERVTVAGGRRIPEKQALKLLRKEFLGRNLFTVTTADVHETLGRLCYLSAVEVDRDFPTTLRVRLTEPSPADPASPSPSPSPSAAPADARGEEATTGDDVAADVAAALAAGPPQITLRLPRVAAAGLPEPGSTIADEGVRATLGVLVGMPRSLRARVAVVRADRGGQVSLELRDGLEVQFGGQERLAAKVLALRAVLAAYRRGGVTPDAVDVSVPDRPLARPRLRS